MPTSRRAVCIAIDTREQRPFRFSKGTPCVKKTLKRGDYSLMGMERRVCVERKSFDDLFYSFTRTRLRMMIRLDELAEMDASALIVECTMSQVIAGHPRTVVVGSRLLGTLLVECAKRGVLILFCSSRREAALACEHFLLAFARHDHARTGGMSWLQRMAP